MNMDFWKATAIRCARSFISVIMGVWTAGTLITEIDWKTTLLAAFSTTVYIFLACILAGLPEVNMANTIAAMDNDPDEDEEDEEDEEEDEEVIDGEGDE